MHIRYTHNCLRHNRHNLHEYCPKRTFKALNNLAPSYLLDLLNIYIRSRTLRSSSSLTLVLPRTRTTSMGSRAFSFAAPYLWNLLPQDVRNSESIHVFKSCLKTHLFRQAFMFYVIFIYIYVCVC